MEYLQDVWEYILNSDNRDLLSWLGGLLAAICGFIFWVWTHVRKKGGREQKFFGLGGRGGNAKVVGQGTAVGGIGGKGGALGIGGDGGSAEVVGNGLAIGGDGGDAGYPFRPALGAPSVMERQKTLLGQDFSNDRTAIDKYGLIHIGRGGDSYECEVSFDDRKYPLNVLLRLLRIWDENILVDVDTTNPDCPQDWWNTAVDRHPELAFKAMEHIRYCEDHAMLEGLPPRNPYL
ncbi:hypothetical protein [Roseovarius sp. MMSF_3281]|uniref:hypothetical protein n=1 Tax=Roseovarius sp. MMSF_3281 TaxID=3046694 RepID=UPI00273E4E2B|nr:hypothetical protein [Roseovarius sp. MMSF_3281]